MPSSKKEPLGAPPPSESNPTPSSLPGEDSPDLWKLIQGWAWKRFGLFGLVVLSGFGIWWEWDHVSKLPGIAPLVARITEKALPKAVPGKFNIALTHSKGTTNRRWSI